MKKRYYYFLMTAVGVGSLLNGCPSVSAEDKKASGAIEMIMRGERYQSVRQYKRQQTKALLKEALSSQNLKDLTDEEIYDVIREVRKKQLDKSFRKETAESVGQKTEEQPRDISAAGKSSDLSAQQMREMLKGYYDEHKDAGYVTIDPDKVKSVIISPKEKADGI